ncbi:hypothetical protein V8E51_003667 [Hyaloscypha variabilis]
MRPDKNPDDPRATIKFHSFTAAYETLRSTFINAKKFEKDSKTGQSVSDIGDNDFAELPREKRDSKEAQKAERQKNNAKSQEAACVMLAMDGGRENSKYDLRFLRVMSLPATSIVIPQPLFLIFVHRQPSPSQQGNMYRAGLKLRLMNQTCLQLDSAIDNVVRSTWCC